MKEILVLYHKNCLDGFASALAAYMKFGDTAEYIEVQYGESPPDCINKVVYILDFSYSRTIIEQLYKDAKELLLIDHHKTAEKDLGDLPYAIFNMNKSGCVLTWEYFHNTDIPKLFKYIQDRDLWKFKLVGTENITLALRTTVDRDFKEWMKFIKHTELLNDLNDFGIILNSITKNEISYLLTIKHNVILRNIGGLAVNACAKYSSELGHELANISNTFGAVYQYNGDKGIWIYSLRSNGEFDVSDIAKSYGGGGHKNAAGFTTKYNIFENKDS